jgi:hypothetical protein
MWVRNWSWHEIRIYLAWLLAHTKNSVSSHAMIHSSLKKATHASFHIKFNSSFINLCTIQHHITKIKINKYGNHGYQMIHRYYRRDFQCNFNSNSQLSLNLLKMKMQGIHLKGMRGKLNKVEVLLNIYWKLNYSNKKNSSSNSVLLSLLLAMHMLSKNLPILCLYCLTLPLVGVCTLSIHQKECWKCWGLRYTLDVCHLSKTTGHE